MEDMNLQANSASMNHMLRAYAVKGDTAGVENALTSFLEKGFVLTTQSINSILILILNTPGELDWDKFTEIHSSYFDSGSLLRNDESYMLLFSAAQKSSNRVQATLWYNKLLEDGRVTVSPSLRDAFHNAIGDEDFNKYNLQLTTIQRNKLSVLDNPPQRYRKAVAEKILKSIKKKTVKKTFESAAGDVGASSSSSHSNVKSDLESALKKVWVPSSSSKVASDSAAGNVESPISSSHSNVKSGLESAVKKVWVPSSSSKIASDSAASNVEAPMSKTPQVTREAPNAVLQRSTLSSSSTLIESLSLLRPLATTASSDSITFPPASKLNALLIRMSGNRVSPLTVEVSRMKILRTLSLRESKLKQVLKPTWQEIIEGTIARKSYMSSGHGWI